MNRHLNDSQVTYTQHSRWAFVAGLRLLWAGFTSLLHAVHPSLFPGTAAETVIDLYYSRLHNHPNGNYKKLIKQYKK
jgi:hypothetical protein